ncbi:hypothetical protein amb2681 [Paramagnetospirillum magneticum AMB-1]|uniref:Uncharacterized protein n=1 Tax=Paramagnetospirillum magneticum (strain ATCC 700264 / AMB-1) TaxID=342108 RepID=Q2W3U0_PARM1|nr:hypothetical protein amb2681 [Paramagnetospirillum magneticum AMB-1]
MILPAGHRNAAPALIRRAFCYLGSLAAGLRALVSLPSSKMLNRLRRKPGVSADSGLTVTDGSSVGPFME